MTVRSPTAPVAVTIMTVTPAVATPVMAMTPVTVTPVTAMTPAHLVSLDLADFGSAGDRIVNGLHRGASLRRQRRCLDVSSKHCDARDCRRTENKFQKIPLHCLLLFGGSHHNTRRFIRQTTLTPHEPPRYNGRLSCFFAGTSVFLSLSIASARAMRRRVECGMITSSR